MFSLNRIKIFLVFILLGCQSCGFWKNGADATTPTVPLAVEELKSEIPFSNKEPETFQTEIVVAAGGAEEKFFVAKNGANRLTIFNYQKTDETRVLEIGENRKFTIAPSRKIYAENQTMIADGESDALFEFLTAELLNRKQGGKFEALGAENNLAKYRVGLDDARQSEIIIYVDEKIGLPVKQEFYGGESEQKKITFAVELKNFSLQTDASVFEVPKDYRKVSMKEFREILRRKEDKNDKRAE